ncbi:MAG: phosphate transporter ATP-binding protein, PhoT family [Firmicutes bacterium]|nr:phosphate transporter ATP-binding protein, PhoT family [Bacillota bacterium]
MIEVLEFDAFFKQKQILYCLSATFHSNCITALIGPSGCGKTTLLKSINRTAELNQGFHSKGKIIMDNTNVYSCKDSAVVRRQIGMVMQKPLALPLSIKENILFGPRYYGMQDKTELEDLAENTLRKVGLWQEVKDKVNSSASELSGGQLQRLSIARSLAICPKTLLLDEPCSSLDMKSTRAIEELLLTLSTQLTIIIVTHNVAQAKRIAAETMFMSEGKIIECGITQHIFEKPQHPLTQEFITF